MSLADRTSLSLTSLLKRRFARAEEGATAVEFALLGPIFFAIVGASMETALVFFAGQALDSAVNDTSRFIRTGQVQAQDMSASQYKDAICDRLFGLFDCNGLRVSVREIDTFASYSGSGMPPLDDDGEWTIAERYQPGVGRSIVVVDAYYKWPTIIAIPGLMNGVTPDGKRLLSATRVFRNEPFGATGGN